MNDDELMDQLLRKTMAAEAPKLSDDFEARVIQQLRPRRLTTAGRAIIALYIVVASATTAWLMRDLPMTAILPSIAISIALAAATGLYGRHLAGGR